MVAHKTLLPLALFASAVLAVPAAQAAAEHSSPVAHSAGGGTPPLNPAVIGVAIVRTDTALSSAADFIDQGNGAMAAKPLTASRKYLIRSYNGARYLIAHPPAPAAQATASAAKFQSLARRFIRASRRGPKARSRWILAHASGGAPAGPAFADNPTAVFNVFMSEYSGATAAVGMYPDTTGALQNKVKTTLNTAIILRNRLVKAVHAAEPTAAAASVSPVHAHSSGTGGAAPTYAAVMPGLVTLLGDEIKQMQATVSTVPAASRPTLNSAIAADTKIKNQVNTWWPPTPAG
jgi:hypothetical protein